MKNINNKTLRKYRGIFAHQQWNRVTRFERLQMNRNLSNPIFSDPLGTMMKFVGKKKPNKNIKVLG